MQNSWKPEDNNSMKRNRDSKNRLKMIEMNSRESSKLKSKKGKLK